MGSNRRATLSLIILAAVLASAGVVDKADNVTHRVLDLVDAIEWTAIHKPFRMPDPIDATAFRPLSVLALKIVVSIWGSSAPPSWLAGLKAFCSLALYGMAAVGAGASVIDQLRRAAVVAVAGSKPTCL